MNFTASPRSLRLVNRRRLVGALAAIAWATLGGCQTVLETPPQGGIDKLLRPVTTSPDSVTLEIFHARIPLEQDGKADALWTGVDEQCFAVELRRRLVANRLRAGVVGGTLPPVLTELLELKGEMPKESNEQVISSLTAVPQVSRRVVQVNRRDPTSIHASETRGEAQVLMSDDGAFHGRTYRQVEAVYTLKAEAVDGQRVTVRLIPELDHGDLKNRYSAGSQGLFVMTPSREREVFDRLAMEVTLSPGEVLVLGSLPDAGASLGGLFHTAVSEGRQERKLILIRLLESPRSEILAAK